MRRQSDHLADYRHALGTCRRGIWSIQASKAAPRSRASSPNREATAPGRAIPMARRFIPAPPRSSTAAEREARIASGEPYALRLDMEAAIAPRRGALTWAEAGTGPAGETETPDGQSGGLGRRRAGAQGDADQLSSLGRGRRRAAGHHRIGARPGSVPCHQCAPAAAAPAWAARAGLSPPSPDPRRGRPQARQIDRVDRPA